MGRLLKTKDLADRLQLSSQTILQWAEEGKIPGGYRINGAIRFDEAKIDRWLADKAIGSRVHLQEVKDAEINHG